ncbi:MAG: hypothetical protein AB8B95_05940 [Pseudohongiellaceae bacterium]
MTAEDISIALTLRRKIAANGASNFNVELLIENASSKPLMLLPWGTPWEEQLARNIFTISVAGKKVEYKGPIIKRRAPESGDYVEIAPKEILAATLDLSRYYELRAAETAQVTYVQRSLSALVENEPIFIEVPEMGVLTFHNSNNKRR